MDQNINLILDMALAQMNDEFRISGIKMEKDFATDLPHVKIDAGRIQQVFLNIFIILVIRNIQKIDCFVCRSGELAYDPPKKH